MPLYCEGLFGGRLVVTPMMPWGYTQQGCGQVWHKPKWDSAWLCPEIGCITYNLHNFAYLWICLCRVVFIQQDSIQWSFVLRSSCCKIATLNFLHSNLLDLCGTVGGTFLELQQTAIVSEHVIHKTPHNYQRFLHQVESFVLPSLISTPRHSSLWPQCMEFRLGEVQLAPSGDMDMDASMRKTSKSCAGTADVYRCL